VTAALETVLAYRHDGVVARYRRDHGGTEADAREVFEGLLAFLYLSARSIELQGSEVVVGMYPEILKLDWMWHSFILHTRDYADFCRRHFGFFLHHEPAAPASDGQAARRGGDAGLREFLSFAYDELGEETVRRWFAERRFAAADPGRAAGAMA
jgi:hypothetical protein